MASLITFILLTLLSFSLFLLTLSLNSDQFDLISEKAGHYDVYNEEGHRISKREDEDIAKLKKGAPTKKPTQLIKQKVDQKPVKSNSSQPLPLPLPVTPQGHNESVPLTTEVPFIHPEDVTLPANATTNVDHHMYYNSTFFVDPQEVTKFWADLSKPDEHVIHEMLSNSHRRAATVQLKFNFPFYGHSIRNITIATGGFLYLGDTVHSWLAATQYIAPLMANFDTSISNSSNIKYINNETTFIVQWNDVMLQDENPKGNFSFQVTLSNNGDIVFVYKEVPFPITDIPDGKHPVKVGISDAYVIDRTVFFIRRKTIYEYHRADLKKENITNNTGIYFKALPTCVSLTSCESCLNAKIDFECKWCGSADRCSDGFDRHRQDWLVRSCDAEQVTEDKCKSNATQSSPSGSPSGGTQRLQPAIPGEHQKHDQHADSAYYNAEGPDRDADKGKMGLISFLVIVAFVSGVALWLMYAYKNPQSSSGQLLIKYRPTEWRWRPSEARYTAASIHM